MKFVNQCIKTVINMSVFVKHSNPVTGRNEWKFMKEDYDFHQEVARAAYADMLHDASRNQLYYAGLRSVIAAKHAAGEKAHVLDIGTGTGLLSMMAAKCGADTIVACEAFAPMAKCARAVIKENGFEDKIKVIGKRSTELKVGEDLPHRANILVTEVFDTELIGEGAIGTFRHALQHLLEVDSLVVPSTATVYIQLVEGDLFKRWHRLQSWKNEKGHPLINIPPSMTSCPGASVVHDLQLSALPNLKTLSHPIPVLHFDWTKPDIPKCRDNVINILPKTSGKCCAVYFWWDLNMDSSGEHILSCAPSWMGNPHWRDHWIQAIYYLPKEIDIIEGKEITLHACHDEFSTWFYPVESPQLELQSCKCGLHQTTTYTRIGNLNDESRRVKYLKVLSTKINETTKALVTGDGSMLPSLIKQLGALQVYTMDDTHWCKELAKFNNLDIKVITKEDAKQIKDLNLICSEPNYDSAILPWYNLAYWYIISEINLQENVVLVPSSATLWAMPIQLEHLWKIRAPLGHVEGFSMKSFDDLIESSSEVSDCPVEPQPLWEYTNTSLGEPVQLLDFDFSHPVNNRLNAEGSLNLSCSGTLHAVGIWMDWKLDENTITSTGPTEKPIPGYTVSWDKHTRQGFYLIRPYAEVTAGQNIQFTVIFNPDSGHIDFTFKLSNFVSS